MSVHISDSLYLAGATEYPLNHARIGYRTIATADNVIGSTETAGFPAVAAVNPTTYDYWLPTALPAVWTVDYGEAVDVDYVGIAAHNFADNGVSVNVEYSTDGVSWTSVALTAFADVRPAFLMFEKTFARYWRVTFDGSVMPKIGVIYIGELMTMQRPFYGGHTPITLGRRTEFVGSMSDGGQLMGTSIIRKGVGTSFEWQHLTAAWVRQTFDPFIKATRGAKPFFISWNPLQFPREVGYVQVMEDIQPSNMGIRDLMQVGFTASGWNDD